MSKGNNKWNCGRAFTVHCSLHRQRFICKTLQQSTRVDMPRFYDLLTVNSKVEMILTSSVATGPAWASSKGLLSVLASLSPPRSPLVWNQIFWKVRLPSFLKNHPWNSFSWSTPPNLALLPLLSPFSSFSPFPDGWIGICHPWFRMTEKLPTSATPRYLSFSLYKRLTRFKRYPLYIVRDVNNLFKSFNFIATIIIMPRHEMRLKIPVSNHRQLKTKSWRA